MLKKHRNRLLRAKYEESRFGLFTSTVNKIPIQEENHHPQLKRSVRLIDVFGYLEVERNVFSYLTFEIYEISRDIYYIYTKNK
ncbi:hypothetical protein UREOM_3190 [Ureaplasma sp. OM1]|uniref:Uncharacterized protein n=1 Tax=Ureaplasma ceti TaxID=3119530 RepID=A0ABP9U5J2_9BACT